MAERHHVTPTAAFAKHAHRWLVWRGLLLSLALLTSSSGCREESSNVQGPSLEAEPGKVVEGAEETEVVPAPRIVFDKKVHDFGRVGPGTSHSARFEFKNEGTAPLKITLVRSCCGVVTRGVKAGQVYKPGESGALELDYRASMQPSPFDRKLYIQSNDPILGVATLVIKATVVPRIAYTPARLRLFMNRENAGAEDIKLTSLDGKPFSIKGFRATAKSMTADFDPSVKATEFVLKPKMDMKTLARNLKGQISIDLTHPECPNIRLLYDVLPEFTISPGQLMLFNVQAGQPVQREVMILSNYREDFEIESVSSQKGAAKLLESKRMDNRYRLKIEITPPVAKAMSDVIEVKIKDGPTLTIVCRGYYQGK